MQQLLAKTAYYHVVWGLSFEPVGCLRNTGDTPFVIKCCLPLAFWNEILKQTPFVSAYSTVSGVNGPLVILDNVKVSLNDYFPLPINCFNQSLIGMFQRLRDFHLLYPHSQPCTSLHVSWYLTRNQMHKMTALFHRLFGAFNILFKSYVHDW